MSKKTIYHTPIFRAQFVDLFEVAVYPDSDADEKPKYGITALFPAGTDMSDMKANIRAAAVEKWGEVPEECYNPIRRQSVKVGKWDGATEDGLFVKLSCLHRPGVADANVVKIINPDKVYGGMWALASYTVRAYQHKGKTGVAVDLVNVQKIRDDDPLSRGGTAIDVKDDFQPYVDKSGGASQATASDFI